MHWGVTRKFQTIVAMCSMHCTMHDPSLHVHSRAYAHRPRLTSPCNHMWVQKEARASASKIGVCTICVVCTYTLGLGRCT